MRRFLLMVAAGCCLLVGVSQALADDDAEAKRIVEKAVAAHGGAAKLSKLKTLTWKSKGTFHGPMGAREFTGEYAIQFPDKSRFDVSAGNEFAFISALDGDKGWVKFGDQSHEMDPGAVAEVKESLHGIWLATVAPLTDKSLSLQPLGESKVGDQTVLGVKVSRKDHRDVLLYFDKETGLLAKRANKAKDLFQGGKEVEAAELYSDYKEFDGVKQPTRVKELRDGEAHVEESRSDYKLPEKLDDKLFVKP